MPTRFTTVFGRAARAGKILIDYKRNHRAAVAIAAFSTRARPSGTVSVPIDWDDLKRLSRPDVWTVLNARERYHDRAALTRSQTDSTTPQLQSRSCLVSNSCSAPISSS
jgi:DNA primase